MTPPFLFLPKESTLGLNYPGLRGHQGVELHLSGQRCISGKHSYVNSEVGKPILRGFSVQPFCRITFRSNGHPLAHCYCNALHCGSFLACDSQILRRK